MTSIVTANPAPGGLPREAGNVHGFLMLAAAMLLSALAWILIPGALRPRHGEIEHAELGLTRRAPSWVMNQSELGATSARRLE